MVRVLLDSGADVKVMGISYVGFGRRLVTGRCDIAAGGGFEELVVDCWCRVLSLNVRTTGIEALACL